MKVLLYRSILPAIALAAAGPALARGDAAKGKLVFGQCSICHKIDKTGSKGIGPNLYGVVGRPAGAVAGFVYSPALAKLKLPWTAQRLDGFLASPARAVPGTRMPFAGLKTAADREDVIAYIVAASR